MGLGSKLKKKVEAYKTERKRKKKIEDEIRKLEQKEFEKEYRKGRIEQAKRAGRQAGIQDGKQSKRNAGTSRKVAEWILRRSEAANRNLRALEPSRDGLKPVEMRGEGVFSKKREEE